MNCTRKKEEIDVGMRGKGEDVTALRYYFCLKKKFLFFFFEIVLVKGTLTRTSFQLAFRCATEIHLPQFKIGIGVSYVSQTDSLR